MISETSIVKGNSVNNQVTVDGEVLSPSRSQNVWDHSPDGFSWGYAGSGPAQLALALLLETTDGMEAMKYYQAFKWDIIARLGDGDFTMPADVIYDWLDKQRSSENKT